MSTRLQVRNIVDHNKDRKPSRWSAALLIRPPREDLCLSYAGRWGIRTSVVRLFSVYGPSLRKQLLWDACEKFRRGDNTFAGTGSELRDWLHVKDAAALIATAAEREALLTLK